jgi:Glutamyl- and glutaminyl-tRNA synthetases
LLSIIDVLQKEENFTHDSLASAIKTLAKDLGLKLVDLAQPIRISLVGTSASPGIFELLEIFGKAESLKRLNKFSDNL